MTLFYRTITCLAVVQYCTHLRFLYDCNLRAVMPCGLQPDGVFIGSMLGGDTLTEVSQCSRDTHSVLK